MKLLFVTQKLHEQDAFTALWVRAFAARGYDVHVVCQQWNEARLRQDLGWNTDEPLRFTVHSLGKERGLPKWRQILTFWNVITAVPHDRVFVHMAPVWGLLGAWYWIPKRTPVYTWYTHYKRKWSIWLLGLYGRRFFCATAQSLPQYNGNPKKVVTGHGIDTVYWPIRENRTTNEKELLMVHRLSRSKRVELTLRALTLLPEHTLKIYGIEAEPEYVAELKALVNTLGLRRRVTFCGTLAAAELPNVYACHRLMINMASETIDKTMIEALTCGCYVLTTARNAQAIGLPVGADTAEDIAAYVLRSAEPPLSADAMYELVRTRHSLESLVAKMDVYISAGK